MNNYTTNNVCNAHVIVEFEKCDNIYNNISQTINNTSDNNKIIVNGIIIKYQNKKWIVGTAINIDGNNINNCIKVLIISENKYYKYKITNIESLLKENIIDNINNKSTIFFDQHLNLFFIRFEEESLFYELDNYDIYELLKNNYDTTDIKCKWLDTSINGFKYYETDKKIISNYYYPNSNYCLPPVPYLICNNENNEIPITGAVILNNNNLIGIVSYICDEIIITPLMSIIRSLNYFNGHRMNIMKINTENVKLTSKNMTEYGLLVKSNYYNKLKKYNNDMTDLLFKGTIITMIDDNKIDEDGYIINDEINIPYQSYIWLLTNDSNINLEIYNRCKKINETYNIKIINKREIKYEFTKHNFGVNIDKIKYIKYNNKYIIQLNDKFIEILKSIMNNDIIKYLENYKFNIKNTKILVGIDLLKPTEIKIVYKSINIDNIKGKITKQKLKKYINYLLK